MKKFLNVLKIIVIVLLILCGVAFVVGYFIFPRETRILLDLIQFYLNQPLPIIGLSTIAVLLFVYKLFGLTKFGKKSIQEQDNKIGELTKQVQAQEEFVIEKQKELEQIELAHHEEIEYLKKYLVKLCESSLNVNVQALAQEIESGFKERKDQIATDLGEYKDKFVNLDEDTQGLDFSALKEQILAEVLAYVKETNTNTEEE